MLRLEYLALGQIGSSRAAGRLNGDSKIVARRRYRSNEARAGRIVSPSDGTEDDPDLVDSSEIGRRKLGRRSRLLLDEARVGDTHQGYHQGYHQGLPNEFESIKPCRSYSHYPMSFAIFSRNLDDPSKTAYLAER